LTLAQFRIEIAALRIARAGDGAAMVLLDGLEAWGNEIEAGLSL
jgi:hypothetical protein